MAAENQRTSRPATSNMLEPPGSQQPVHLPPNLAVEATSIVDREEDLAAISSLLLTGEVRLLTLTGPAGVGKTRLAREVGRTLAPSFSHGVVLVDLAPMRDPALVLATLAKQLGVLDSGGPPVVERLQAYLADREMLVILDNAEQMLPADAGLAELLIAAPRTTLLVTSREPLHLLSEQLYHVKPLALPDPEHLPDLEQLAQVPSVALFLRRARMINPGFQLTAENAKAIAELTVHLDGLPLAIKLAASRTQLLSPQMLLERLGQRLSLLRWQAPDLPARQQTLRAAIAWSYDHLAAGEQSLFRSLGIFVGGFSLGAAESIAGATGQDPSDALEGLASLVDKSLVQREVDEQGGYRFRLLESVRDFALEQLVEAGELDATKRSHALFYLALAEQAEPDLTGPQQRMWFLQLEETHDNLRAALEWLLNHEEGEPALRLAVALGHFWEIRGYLTEGRRWLEAALAGAPTAAPALRARAMIWLGAIAVLSIDQPDARETDDAARSEDILTEGMELARAIGDTVSIARALTWLGTLSLQTGDWDQGIAVLQEAETYLEEAGHNWEIIQTILPRAIIAFLQGQYEDTMQLMNEVLIRYRDVGDDWGRGVALVFEMNVVATRGDRPRAVIMGREILALSVESHSGRILYLSVVGTVWLARTGGNPEQLARLLGAAESMSQAVGLVANLMQQVFLAPATEILEARMGREELNAAMPAGRYLSFSEVADLVRDVLDEAVEGGAQQEVDRGGDQTGVLSPRELEVLQLVGEGLSNKQIARELFIAESTVRYHLTSVFNKLGVDTRTHALAVAAQRGLIQLGRPS